MTTADFMTPSIPFELCDKTIDFLWDDPHALRACSLTCRAWLPTTRIHLFNSVFLHGPDEYARFISLLDVSAKASTGLEFYVRQLSLKGRVLCDWNNIIPKTNKTLVVPLSQLLMRLSRVEHLSLTAARYIRSLGSGTADEAEHYRAVLRCLCQAPFAHSVHTLRLAHVTFADSTDFDLLLSSYPHLARLELDNVFADKCFPLPQLTCQSPRTPLEDLVFLQPDIPLTMTGWLAGASFERLHTLDWQGRVARGGRPILGSLLKRAGPALEHARLYLRLQREEVDQNWLVDLSPCTRLVSLDISCDRWLPALLAQLCSPRLARITICVHLFRGYEAQMGWFAWDWRTIDAHLARIGRAHLHFETVFRFFRRDAEEGWLAETAAFVACCLPAARQAGVRVAVSANRSQIDQMPYAQRWLAELDC